MGDLAETPAIDPQLEDQRTVGASFWDEPPATSWWSWWHIPELTGVFITAVVVMNFLYGRDEGVPGYDSFYHVKMAVLLPEIGPIERFQWLTTTIFEDRFVSHHWGFHLLMVPFVHAGRWLAGDYLVGAKWGITFFFALSVVLFHLLLMVQRVRFRWLWLGLYLVMPAQFFNRHMYVRAIAPSLACMFLILLLMFRPRYAWCAGSLSAGEPWWKLIFRSGYAWCAVVIAAYVHLYLGALFYVPLIVGAYFVAGLLGEDRDRVSWTLPVWALAGLLLGLLSHPYRDGVFEFLSVQVLGSGLTPDIPVGREWRSYTGDLWDVVYVHFGVTLSLLIVSVVARLRLGDRLNAREAAVFVVNLVFLTMAFRQRRFIEYWPPFGLLASAYLLAPLLDRLADNAAAVARERGPARLWLSALAIVILTYAAGVYLLWARGPRLGIGGFVAEWRTWALVTAVVLATPMSIVWHCVRRFDRLPGPVAGAFNFLCGAVVLALIFGPVLLVFGDARRPAALLHVPFWAWIPPGLAYLLLPLAGNRGEVQAPRRGHGTVLLATATTVFTGAAFGLLLILGAAGQLVELQRSSRCNFDLGAIRAAMAYLHENSAEDSIIFTDDWDVFPVYFYHNHRNRYIVGLDPKFSHARDPVLWERYVKITQSKDFPVTTEAECTNEDGTTRRESISVRLEDIRDHFGAAFVMTDPDHTRLARNLEAAPDLAERVFPPAERQRDRWPPITIYRIKPRPQVDGGVPPGHSTEVNEE